MAFQSIKTHVIISLGLKGSYNCLWMIFGIPTALQTPLQLRSTPNRAKLLCCKIKESTWQRKLCLEVQKQTFIPLSETRRAKGFAGVLESAPQLSQS